MREFWLVNGTLVRWHCLPEHAVWPTDDATFGCNGGVRACPDPRTGEGRPTQPEAKGVRLGRPRVFVSESQIEALRASGTPWRAIAKELGVCLNNSCRNSAHENVVIVETRHYRNFAPFVRQIGEKKSANLCYGDLSSSAAPSYNFPRD